MKRETHARTRIIPPSFTLHTFSLYTKTEFSTCNTRITSFYFTKIKSNPGPHLPPDGVECGDRDLVSCGRVALLVFQDQEGDGRQEEPGLVQQEEGPLQVANHRPVGAVSLQ